MGSKLGNNLNSAHVMSLLVFLAVLWFILSEVE